MTRTLPSSAVLQLASTDAYCWLISVAYSDINTGDTKYLRVASNPVSVAFTEVYGEDPETYSPTPFTIDPLKETSDASNYEEWKVTMPDPTGLVKSWIRQNESLAGRSATMYLVRIADGSAPAPSVGSGSDNGDKILEQPFLMKEVSMVDTAVQWTLGPRNFLFHTFPGRRCFRSRCGHIFRGARCAYSGTVLTCDYTFDGANGCSGKDNINNYGGFVHIPFGNDR